jgi:hypothetical protein
MRDPDFGQVFQPIENELQLVQPGTTAITRFKMVVHYSNHASREGMIEIFIELGIVKVVHVFIFENRLIGLLDRC